MSRALVTFAVGNHQPLLGLALPGFSEYADRHGYQLLTDPPSLLLRPPSWGKLVVVLDALAEFDEVLWIDSDVIILNPDWDLADDVPDEAWHAITVHHTPEGEIPSCGVWLVRQPMRKPIEDMWRLTRYLHHPWWEQAALLDRLGYNPTARPVALLQPTDLYQHTYWLGVEWNALALEYPSGLEEINPLDARMVHCGPGSSVAYRADLMRNLTNPKGAHLVQVPPQ